MIPKLLLDSKNHVEDMIELLSILNDEVSRKKFLDTVTISDKSKTKTNRLNLGYFSKPDLREFMFAFLKQKGKPLKAFPSVLNLTMDRLMLYHIIIESPISEFNEFQLNSEFFELYRNHNHLDSIVFGVLYTLEKYKRSIPAVNVINSEGDKNCGSGLLVKVSSNKLLMLMCLKITL